MILSLYATAAPKLLPINYTGQISGNQASNAGYTPSTITSVSSATGTEGTVYYLWEKSTDGTTWTDISGATSASYTPAAITQTTYYRRKSRIGTSGAWEGYSNIVSKVVTNFSITTSSNITTGSAIVLDEAGDFPEVYNQLVVNGDFSNGNTGFISSLTYTTSTTPAAYTYKVAENSQNLYSGTDVTHFKDRTSGVGKMMLGDGKTTANHIVWESTLPVVAGNTYSMSVWVRAIRDVNRPQLKWSVNDANFGTTVTAAYGSWTQVTHTYTATATGNVDFSIYNARGIDAGNMFAIDDVSILESSAISYAWSGPNGFSSTAINPTISGATSVNSGTYNLTISKGGLSVQTSKVIQVVNAAVTCSNTLSLAATNATCGGLANGSITATAANGFGGSGTVTVQGWFNISGTAVSDLTSNTSYPNSPSYTSVLTLAETPTNVADNFGGRLVGYIVPKTTGTYYFWIASDDSGEFWLSTTNSPANKVLRASVNGYTGVREWNKFTSQKSAAITLTAGQVYYFEALYKEGGGGDNLAIGWAKPGEATTTPSEVIPATALRPYSGTSATDPVYQYKIGTGAFQTSNVFSNLAAGTYSVTVQDSYGCSVNSSVTITAPSTITTTPTSNSPVCKGQTLTLNSGTVSGGSGTISYLWTGPNGFSSTAQNPSITNVTSSNDGTYTLKVTRGSCFSTFTIDVEIDNSPAATTTFVNPSCGTSDGKITFNYPVGSDNDMQISLDGGSTWPYTATAATGSFTATGLSAGTKNIRLRWATGTACVTTIPSVTLVAGTALQGITMSPNVTICTGTSTTISGTPQNGTAPFTYTWSPNVGNTSSVTVSPASTTTYTLTVTSAGGCSASNQVVVTTSTNPVVTITTPDSTICALGGYTLTSAINLSSSFNYQWQTNNNGTWNDILLANGASYTVLLAPAGNVTYRLKITNSSSSCNIGYSNFFTVKVLTSPVASVVSASNKICLNQSTTFSASVSNGAGAITYQWQKSTDNLLWSNIAGQTSVSYSPVTNAAGATYYRVIANMSGTGCTQAISNAYLFTVVNPGTMNITPAATTLCLNGTQLLTSSVSGSNGSYTYQWQKSSNAGVSWRDMNSATGSTYSPTNDSLGTYKYRVKANASVCGVFYSGTADITVVQPHSVDASITNATVCINGSTTLSGSALNLTGTGTYQWMISSNETGPWVNVSNGSGGTTDSYTPATGTAGRYYYKLRVTSPASNCGAVDSEVIMLNVVAQVTVTVSPVSSSICLNSVNYLNAVTENGVGPFTYQWQVSSTSGSGYSNIAGATGSSLLIPAGTANTRYYKVMVTPSGAGCNAVTSAFSTVIVMPLPTVSASNTSNSSSSINQCVGTLFKLFATSTSSPTTVTGYSWASAGGFSSNDQNPLGLATSTASGGTYTVTATGANGCTNTATTNVIINSNCDNRCTSIIDVRPLNPTDCASATGNITVDEFGGSNYETSMDGINWFRGYKVYSALGVGSYLVFLRDYSSKIICRTVNITLEAKTTAFFTGQTVTNATGCKVANGSIRLTGVLSTDQVSWISSRTPTYVAVSTLTNQTIPNLLPGTYYVRVIRGGQYCYSERMVTVGNSGTPCISNQICTTTDLVNLFPNGDFGSGSTKHGPVLTGAETQYGYSLYNCNAPNDGFYTIVNNTDCDGAGGKTFGGSGGAGGWDVLTQDHTTGDTGGYMMVVNASHNPDIVVEKSISNLCPKTQYNFTAWIYNLIPNEDIKPNLSFLIDGVVYYVTGNITTNGWKQVGFSFTTGNITSSVFSIRNNAPGGDGNDWVIDDIVVSKCPMNITMNANVVACVGTASKTITATVADPYQEYVYYKWQESSNNGASWTDISTVTSGTYSGGNMTVSTIIPGPFTYAQSGKKYRIKLATTASSIDDATCSVASAEATLTVPQITTTITAPIEKCAGTGSSTLTAAGGGGTSPYTYSWSDTLGSTASVTANPTATKTYTVTVTDANGCSTTATTQITIKPLPVASATGTTICSGETFSVTPTTSITGTKYTWTAAVQTAPTGGTVTGLSNQTTAVDGPFAQTLINSGTTNAVIRYTVTPIANGCSGATFPFDVIVKPLPTVNKPASQVICNGATVAAVNFTGTIAGTVFSWTNNQPSIGLAASGTGNIASFTGINTGSTPVVATITVTPNGCPSSSETFTITVNPTADIAKPANQSLCSTGTTNAVNFSGSVSGTTYSWTNNQPSIGLAASGTGNIASFTAVNSGAIPVTATITVTPTANGCPGTPQTFTITVAPKASVNVSSASETVCVGGTVTLTATITNGTGNITQKWQESTNNSTWTDIAGQTSLSLSVPTATAGIKYYRIVVTADGSGCGIINSATSTVTVIAKPTVTVNIPSTTVCIGGTVTLTATASNGTGNVTYQWQESTNNTSWTDIAGQTTSSLSVSTATAGVKYYRVVVTASGSGCGSANSSSSTVTVVAKPTVTVDIPSTTVCVGGTVTLTATASNGTGTVTYQWQESTNNTSWTDVAGQTTTSLSVSTATAGVKYYRIVVTASGSGCGSVNSASSTVTVVAKPTVTVDIPSTTVCIGGIVTLTATASNGTGTVTYQWQESTNNTSWTDISGQTTTSLSVSTATAGVKYYRVVVTASGSGCGSANSASSTVTVVAKPTVTVDIPSTTVCVGGTVTLTATASNGTGTVTYQWQESTNNTSWTNIAGQTTTSLSVSTATAGVKYYRVVVTASGSGCGSANSASSTVTVVAKPTVLVDIPSTTVCIGGTVTLTATASNGTGTVTYQWQETSNNANWTDIAGQTTTSLNVSTATAGVKYYRVVVTASGSGCGSANSASSTVTVVAKPTVSVDIPSTTVCIGGTVTLTATASNGTGILTYQWQESANNTSWTDVAGQTTTSLSVSTATAGVKYYRIVVTASGSGCGSVNSASSTVTVVAKPTVTVDIPSTTVCIGGTVTLTATASNGTGTVTYQWQESTNNTSWTDIAGQTTTSLSVSTATAGVKYYRVVVTASGSGCGSSNSASSTVTVVAKPTVTIDIPSTTVCVGGTVTLTATASNGTGTITYQWQESTNNTSWTDIAGQTTTSLSVSTATAGVKYYRVVVTASGSGCGSVNSASSTVTVVVKPTVTVDIPSTTVCVGGTVTLTATASNGTGTVTYQWQESANNTSWTNIAGQTTTSLSVSTATAGVKYYRVVVTASGSGCGSANSSSSTVTVVAKPTLTVDIPSTTVCVGGTVTLTATASNGTGTVTYQWQESTNNTSWTDIAGQTTTSLSVSTATAGVKYYRVVVTASGSGCGSVNSAGSTVTVVAKPTVTIDIPSTTVCVGGTVTLTATASNGTGTITYQWQESTNNTSWTDIAGQTTTSLSVSTATAGVKYYRVVVTASGSGCGSANSASSTVTVVAKPTVTVNIPSTTVCVGGGLTLNATISNGTGIITQQWQTSTDNTNWTDMAGQTSTSLIVPTSSASVKYYRIIVTASASGCGSVTSSSSSVTVIPQVTIGITPNNNKVCIGESLTLTATINNGTSDLTYQWLSSTDQNNWTSIPGQTALTLSVPTAVKGTTYYRLEITSTITGCGTVKSGFTSVEVRPLPAVTFTKTDALCETGNGKIVFSFQDEPGQTTLEFSLDGGLTYPYSVNDNSGSFTVNALSSSTYQLYARWGGGACPANLGTTTISDRPAPLATSLKTDPTCTISNGTIRFNFQDVAGRTGYKFSLDGGLTYLATVADNSGSVTYTGLAPGTYDLWVKWENNECPVNLPDLTLTDQKGPVVNLGQDLEICNGVSVNITAATTGGTPALIYTWNNGLNGVASHLVSPTITTTYIVTVKDANNCTSKDTLQIIVNANPVLTIANAEVCENQNIKLTSSGGGTYAWTGPNSFVSNLQNPEIVNANAGLHAGVYSLTITNGFGCHTSGTMTVIVNALPAPPTLTGAEKCGPGSLTLNASGCSGTISWFDKIFDGNNVGIGTTFATPTLSETTAYFALCSSTKNCDSPVRSSVLAKINNQPVAEIIPVDPTCLGVQSANNGRIIITRYRDNEKYSFNIGTTYNSGLANVPALIPSNGTISTTIPNPSNNASENYTIRIISNEGCMIDRVIKIDNKCIDCPVDYCPPSTITKIE